MPPSAWVALADAGALARWAVAGKTMPARLLAELHAEAPELGESDVALMPPATPDQLQKAVVPALRRDPAFARAPEWDGVPVETGALARRQAHPLVQALRARDGNTAATRMVARLVDLALVLGQLAAGIAPPREARAVRGLTLGAGEGLATAETARGLLLHRARLVDGKVAAYDIVAPTEWNFHPRGALAQGLARIRARDEGALVRAARIAVQALDPCVACRVEVADA
jgi:Ni,Fe-hydrogenase I large subunit